MKTLYRNKETPFEIKSEEDWKKVKGAWYVSYICNTCGKRHVKEVAGIKWAKNTCRLSYRNKETPFEIKSEEDWKIVKLNWWVSYICNTCGERHVKYIGNSSSIKNTCLKKILYRKKSPFEIKSEEDWKKVELNWYVSYICNICGKRHVKRVYSLMNAKNTCLKVPFHKKETPFEIKSEEDWKKVKGAWWVSYICNTCGERHVKKVWSLKEANNTCQISYKKETPFEIKSEEDWKKVKLGWWVSYICNTCGERHVKYIANSSSIKNKCRISYYKKETPFEIKSEEDWKKVKLNWYVSYICNTCGKRHVKIISNLKCVKNTCLISYRNKEIPFEIKSEEDWKKVKVGWYVSYTCNKCGERHVKFIGNSNCIKNTCLNKIQYYKKETPFEIKSEEDWKKVKLGWRISYICNTCGERHVKGVSNLRNAKNTCQNNLTYHNKETPFEIKSEEDWKKVKVRWYVSYICNKCGERHVKKVNDLKWAKNTCKKKTKNIKE